MRDKIHIVRCIGMALTSLMLLVVMGIAIIGLQQVGHTCCHGSHVDVTVVGIDDLSLCMDNHETDCRCHKHSCPSSDKKEQSEVLKLDFDTLIENIVKCIPIFVDTVETEHICVICLNLCKPELFTLFAPPLHQNPDDWQSVSGVFII